MCQRLDEQAMTLYFDLTVRNVIRTWQSSSLIELLARYT